MNYYVELSDKRNVCLYGLMKEQGYSVYPFEEREGMDCAYIFSPAKKFGSEEIDKFSDGVTLYAGNVSLEIKKKLKDKNITHINFLNSDNFACKNAMLTAEGVLALVIEKTPESIYMNKILVLGFGRCAQAISALFHKLGLNFIVAAREGKGHNFYGEAIDLNGEWHNRLSEFDVIINTVPAKIIDDSFLSLIGKKTMFLEIASVNCLDKEKAEFQYIPAPGLPQVYSAESAARLMFELIV